MGVKKVGERVRRIEPRRVQKKVTESIYGTFEWKEARLLSIAMHAYRCVRCNARPRRLFVDHKIELRDGGAPFDQNNLEPLCGSCHTIKTIEARKIRVEVIPGPGQS